MKHFPLPLILIVLFASVALGAIRGTFCPGGNCPIPPAVVKTAVIDVPVIAVVQPAPKPAAVGVKPFPGPSTTPPRILWVWDNGVIFETGANVWRWQNEDGTWNQK